MKWLTSGFFVRDLELSRYTKIFQKIKISNPMIYTLKSAYQGVRNVFYQRREDDFKRKSEKKRMYLHRHVLLVLVFLVLFLIILQNSLGVSSMLKSYSETSL